MFDVRAKVRRVYGVVICESRLSLLATLLTSEAEPIFLEMHLNHPN